MHRLFACFVLYCLSVGLICSYCLFVQFAGLLFWPSESRGKLIIDNYGQVRGTKLISYTSNDPRYFHSRSIDKINDSCDVALYNEDLRKALWSNLEVKGGAAYDASMVTPSASLLDPYITRREALSQVVRIAQERNLSIVELINLIDLYTLDENWPFFKLQIVNTTVLNTYLDGFKN